MNLREDKHWSYGVRSSAAGALGQRPWMVARAGADRQDRRCDQGNAARDQRLRQRQGAADAGGSGAHAGDPDPRPAGLVTRPRPRCSAPSAASSATAVRTTTCSGARPRSKALTPEQVKVAAATIDPDALTWVVVGDLKQIEAPVRALNLGEVFVVDADGKASVASPVQPRRRNSGLRGSNAAQSTSRLRSLTSGARRPARIARIGIHRFRSNCRFTHDRTIASSATGLPMRTLPLILFLILAPSACTWVHMAPGASSVKVVDRRRRPAARSAARSRFRSRTASPSTTATPCACARNWKPWRATRRRASVPIRSRRSGLRSTASSATPPGAAAG